MRQAHKLQSMLCTLYNGTRTQHWPQGTTLAQGSAAPNRNCCTPPNALQTSEENSLNTKDVDRFSGPLRPLCKSLACRLLPKGEMLTRCSFSALGRCHSTPLKSRRGSERVIYRNAQTIVSQMSLEMDRDRQSTDVRATKTEKLLSRTHM